MCSTLNMMVEVASPCEFFLQNETYACRLVGNATNPPTVVNGVHYGSLGCQWTALLACFLML